MTLPPSRPPPQPLVAHVIERLDVGGMENGVVNLINRLPLDRYRHAVVCLRHATVFRERIRRDDVPIVELHKTEGKSLRTYWDLWRALRRMRPDIVHTRNLPAVDMVVPAYLAGVRRIVHGEHGRDVLEVTGANRKYNHLRRAVSPLVNHYITVSKDIESWLSGTVGVPARKVTQIYNGVDAEKFHPRTGDDAMAEGFPFDRATGGLLVVGTVGRLETVKDQVTLAQAFVEVLRQRPAARDRLRLAIVGDGSLREPIRAALAEGGGADLAWLPGSRNDTPEIYRCLDLFVLPSLNEGISNTVLEAMATGLPVVATNVGGNPELVADGETGRLVPSRDPAAIARTIGDYMDREDRLADHGKAARARIETAFSMRAMMAAYDSVYSRVLSP